MRRSVGRRPALRSEFALAGLSTAMHPRTVRRRGRPVQSRGTNPTETAWLSRFCGIGHLALGRCRLRRPTLPSGSGGNVLSPGASSKIASPENWAWVEVPGPSHAPCSSQRRRHRHDRWQHGARRGIGDRLADEQSAIAGARVSPSRWERSPFLTRRTSRPGGRRRRRASRGDLFHDRTASPPSSPTFAGQPRACGRRISGIVSPGFRGDAGSVRGVVYVAAS